MKRLTLLLLFALLQHQVAQAQNNPRFFVACFENNTNGDAAKAYASQFERIVQRHLSQAFTCSRVKANVEIKESLQHEKIKQLKGTGGDNLRSYCDDLDADYLVSLELSESIGGSKIIANASVMKWRGKIDAFVHVSAIADFSMASMTQVCEEVGQKLINKLKLVEICPFTGNVDVTITTIKDTTTTEDYYVYCNKMDAKYHLETSVYSKSVATWTLQKLGIRERSYGKGTVQFTLEELYSSEEQNPCHNCTTGNKQGPLIKNEKVSKRGSGSGVSTESTLDGKPTDDVRFDISFFEDSTYILEVKCASREGNFTQKTEKRAEGFCDNQSPITETLTKKFTIPLPGKFGPFQGNSLSKVLSETISYPYIDPISGEKQDIQLAFRLERK